MWRRVVPLAALASLACIGDSANTDAAADTTLFLPPATARLQLEGPPHFAYADLSVPPSFDSLLSRYPTAEPYEYSIELDGALSHDRITRIGYTEDPTGWRRLSILFERRPVRGRVEPPAQRYPRCEQVLARLAERYGQEDSLKQFSDGAHVRADRYWNHPNELMVLLCVVHGTDHYAREVTLERFPW